MLGRISSWCFPDPVDLDISRRVLDTDNNNPTRSAYRVIFYHLVLRPSALSRTPPLLTTLILQLCMSVLRVTFCHHWNPCNLGPGLTDSLLVYPCWLPPFALHKSLVEDPEMYGWTTKGSEAEIPSSRKYINEPAVERPVASCPRMISSPHSATQCTEGRDGGRQRNRGRHCYG